MSAHFKMKHKIWYVTKFEIIMHYLLALPQHKLNYNIYTVIKMQDAMTSRLSSKPTYQLQFFWKAIEHSTPL